MMDMEWERVSWRRYAAHFSLCVLTVYISNLITETPFPTAMIWGSAPYIGLIISLATQFGPPGVPASQMYYSITAGMLLYLNRAATTLGKTAEPSFDNTGLQHHAVHFAAAFFVLAELEYRRQYIMTKGMEHFRNYPLDFLLADIDHTFDVSRHPSVYWYATFYDDTGESKRFKGGPYLHTFFTVLDFYSFSLIGGCFNYGIMLMVNQGHTTDLHFMFAIFNSNVFFNTKNLWILLLGHGVLSRFVRQANFITVWGFLRASAQALDWWNGNDTASLDSRYQSSQGLKNDYRLLLPGKTEEKV
ncbi:hypothetical protein AA0118_g10524 [Alternaria tenuissima]|nr:hypothetical protein AA0118_g10524 [Alternaria tenuissima]